MAGLGEVCSHVGAILFYIEAMRCTKRCSISMEYTIISCGSIADIDFSVPKSAMSQTKRGTHLNNDCPMISDSADIERPCSSHQVSSAVTPPFNVNQIGPTESQKLFFFNQIA